MENQNSFAPKNILWKILQTIWETHRCLGNKEHPLHRPLLNLVRQLVWICYCLEILLIALRGIDLIVQ